MVERKYRTTSKAQTVAIIAAVFLVPAIIIAAPYLPGWKGSQRRAETDDAIRIERAKDAVRANLKDGESARFTGVFQSTQSAVVCGYVNAKNSFGAYVGPKRFVAGIGPASVILEDAGKPRAEYMTETWYRLCE